MKIRLLSMRRTFHVPVTSRVGIAAAVALGAVGVIAGGYGIAVAGHEAEPFRYEPAEPIELQDTAPRSLPPTMVLITTTTTTVSSGRVPAENEPQLGAVLRGLFAAANVASGPVVDPDYPGLAVYATGDALDEIRSTLRERHDAGIGRRPSNSGPPSSIRLTDAIVADTTATATACQVDSDELYDLQSGETLDDTVLVRELEVQYARTSTGWKIQDVEVRRVLSGGCG